MRIAPIVALLLGTPAWANQQAEKQVGAWLIKESVEPATCLAAVQAGDSVFTIKYRAGGAATVLIVDPSWKSRSGVRYAGRLSFNAYIDTFDLSLEERVSPGGLHVLTGAFPNGAAAKLRKAELLYVSVRELDADAVYTAGNGAKMWKALEACAAAAAGKVPVAPPAPPAPQNVEIGEWTLLKVPARCTLATNSGDTAIAFSFDKTGGSGSMRIVNQGWALDPGKRYTGEISFAAGDHPVKTDLRVAESPDGKRLLSGQLPESVAEMFRTSDMLSMEIAGIDEFISANITDGARIWAALDECVTELR